jgi:hypothetical protein
MAMVMMDRAGELSRGKLGCGTDWLRPLRRIMATEDLATASNEKTQVAAMFDVCCGRVMFVCVQCVYDQTSQDCRLIRAWHDSC